MAKTWRPTKKYRPEPTGQRVPIHVLTRLYGKLDVEDMTPEQVSAKIDETARNVVESKRADEAARKCLRQLAPHWRKLLTQRPTRYAWPRTYAKQVRAAGLRFAWDGVRVVLAGPPEAITDQLRYDMTTYQDTLQHWLSPQDWCCVCGQMLPEGRRYVCGDPDCDGLRKKILTQG